MALESCKALWVSMAVQTSRDKWGGMADGQFQPSGFFRVGSSRRTFWLVDPDGGCFLSKGVNTVRFNQDNIRDTERIPYAENCRNAPIPDCPILGGDPSRACGQFPPLRH